MMKDKFTFLVQRLEESKKALKDKRDISVHNVQRISEELKQSFDEMLDSLALKRDLMSEAIAQKV